MEFVKLNLYFFKNLKLYSLLLSIFLFTFIHTFTMVRYEENDDIVMNLIASGALTGHPSAYLLFMNIILGFFIQSAYQFLPSIEWYFVHFALAQIVSVAVIIYVFLREYEKSQHKIIFLFLASILIFISNFIIAPQFTYISFLLSTAGYLLIFYRLRKKTALDKKIFAGIALVVWGSWVRTDASIFVTAISLPFFLNFKPYKLVIKILVLGALCGYATWLVNHYIYMYNKEWKDTYEVFYNKDRSKLIAYDNPYMNEETIKDISTKYAKNTLPVKLFMSKDMYSVQITKNDLHNMRSLIKNKAFSMQQIRYIFITLKTYKFYVLIIIGFSFLFTISIFYREKHLYSVLSGLAAVTTPLLMWFYISSVQLSIKAKIVLISIGAVLIFSLYFILYIEFLLNKKLIKYLVVFISLYTIAIFGEGVVYSNTNNRYNYMMYKKNIEKLSKDKTYLYMFILQRDITPGIPVWNISEELKNKRIIIMGWLAPMPHMKYQIKKYFPDYEIKNTWIQPVYEEVVPKYNVILWGHIPPILKEYLEKGCNISVNKSKECYPCYELEPSAQR